ncbi:MAG: hypothetical protein JSS02_08870 [Planctomycetes bacterium]|nr:hypothetical protein [Planctomycetota bacterium]
MLHKPVSGLAGIACLWLCASLAVAQDFHVDTQIYDLKAPGKNGKRVAVGAAESLFHAGRVYDHNRGENVMTIFEPAHERILVIDASRNLKTSIKFAEITDHLIDDRASLMSYLENAAKKGGSADTLAFYRFQLKPEFQVKFTPHEQSPTLVLTNPLVEYHVECAQARPELVKAYLDYADWAARLSFISRRQAMMPDVRIAVNDELRKRNLLPVSVTLHTHTKTPKELHFRADHKYGWQLNGLDKSTITHWDEKADSKNTKQVPWDKYLGPDSTAVSRK